MNNSKKAISILKKVYHHTNADYDTDYYGRIGYKTDFLTQEEHFLLKEFNLVPNNFAKFTHDSLLSGLLAIKHSQKISLDLSSSLFIKGLSGKFPRYRQTLMSFWYLTKIKPHTFKKSTLSTNCAICGLPENTVLDRTHNLFTYYLGHSWNEMPENFLAELQEISGIEKPQLLEEDIKRFLTLLQEIDGAEISETPGQLAKRLGKLKLLPNTDRYKRYGILQTLAVVGVLPNNPKFDNQPSRSDIVPPISGWKGELGVDFDKVTEVFKLEIP